MASVEENIKRTFMNKEHIYENRSATSVTVILPSENNQTATEHVFPPFARMELAYPGLDHYVPHFLTKISADIVGKIELLEEIAEEVAEVVVDIVEAAVEDIETVVEDVKEVVENITGNAVEEILIETDVVPENIQPAELPVEEPISPEPVVKRVKKSK